MSDEPVEGEIIEPGEDQPIDFWNNLSLPPRPFGELLKNLRERIAEAAGHSVTQEQFGELLGNVNQVTISRWQRGAQKPQRAQLERIVALAHEYGLHGLTLERLQRSLNLDIDEYASLDPRLRRLDILLSTEDETFRAEFHEAVIAVFYILKGVTRPRDR